MKSKIDIDVNKLNLLMAKKSLPAYKLAEAAGLSRQTVSTVQHSGTCSMYTAAKLANGLGVTLDELTLKKAPENHQEPETVDELINLFVKKFLEALGKGEGNENQW